MSSVKDSGATRPVAIEDDAAGAEHKPSGVRRVLHNVGAVVVVLVLPALVIGAFVGDLGVSAMLTGVLLGAVGAKLGGTHRRLYVAPALGVPVRRVLLAGDSSSARRRCDQVVGGRLIHIGRCRDGGGVVEWARTKIWRLASELG